MRRQKGRQQAGGGGGGVTEGQLGYLRFTSQARAHLAAILSWHLESVLLRRCCHLERSRKKGEKRGEKMGGKKEEKKGGKKLPRRALKCCQALPKPGTLLPPASCLLPFPAPYSCPVRPCPLYAQLLLKLKFILGQQSRRGCGCGCGCGWGWACR